MRQSQNENNMMDLTNLLKQTAKLQPIAEQLIDTSIRNAFVAITNIGGADIEFLRNKKKFETEKLEMEQKLTILNYLKSKLELYAKDSNK